MPFLVMLPVASTRKTPPGLTLEELAILELERTDELLGILELERELGITEDDELGRLELTLDTTLDELPHAAVTPKGEGWLAQVVLEIQLLLFS